MRKIKHSKLVKVVQLLHSFSDFIKVKTIETLDSVFLLSVFVMDQTHKQMIRKVKTVTHLERENLWLLYMQESHKIHTFMPN